MGERDARLAGDVRVRKAQAVPHRILKAARIIGPGRQWLCALEALPEGGCTELSRGEGEGSLSMLLYRSGREVRAYINCCPHLSLPLNARPGEFLLMSGARIMCAHHCAVFRLDDGRCVDGPAGKTALEAVPIDIRAGHVFLEEK